MKILVVEDEKIPRQSIVGMLKALGFEDILEAADGLEALTIIQKQHPHIILSDIEMPNLDGIALLERIRNLKNPCSIKFQRKSPIKQ
jgi:two-component system chemotaxis response regulator CheY